MMSSTLYFCSKSGAFTSTCLENVVTHQARPRKSSMGPSRSTSASFQPVQQYTATTAENFFSGCSVPARVAVIPPSEWPTATISSGSTPGTFSRK